MYTYTNNKKEKTETQATCQEQRVENHLNNETEKKYVRKKRQN